MSEDLQTGLHGDAAEYEWFTKHKLNMWEVTESFTSSHSKGSFKQTPPPTATSML